MSINEAMRQQRLAEYADQKAYEADRLRKRVKRLEKAATAVHVVWDRKRRCPDELRDAIRHLMREVKSP